MAVAAWLLSIDSVPGRELVLLCWVSRGGSVFVYYVGGGVWKTVFVRRSQAMYRPDIRPSTVAYPSRLPRGSLRADAVYSSWGVGRSVTEGEGKSPTRAARCVTRASNPSLGRLSGRSLSGFVVAVHHCCCLRSCRLHGLGLCHRLWRMGHRSGGKVACSTMVSRHAALRGGVGSCIVVVSQGSMGRIAKRPRHLRRAKPVSSHPELVTLEMTLLIWVRMNGCVGFEHLW